MTNRIILLMLRMQMLLWVFPLVLRQPARHELCRVWAALCSQGMRLNLSLLVKLGLQLRLQVLHCRGLCCKLTLVRRVHWGYGRIYGRRYSRSGNQRWFWLVS